MSRSGYSDSCEGWDLIRWRGAVASAIRGKRGQEFLREMIASLDAMPEKGLTTSALQSEDGSVCAMGAVALKRGLEVAKVDPEDRDRVAEAFGISPALAAEIAYQNDEEGPAWYEGESPEKRWKRMRRWAEKQLTGEAR
jgi:hypothetical protein